MTEPVPPLSRVFPHFAPFGSAVVLFCLRLDAPCRVCFCGRNKNAQLCANNFDITMATTSPRPTGALGHAMRARQPSQPGMHVCVIASPR